MKKAGLNTAPKHGQKRDEFLKLRTEEMTRRESTEAVGVYRRTASDWDNGIRLINGGRIYLDGRVVDYKRGVTTTLNGLFGLSISSRYHNGRRPLWDKTVKTVLLTI